MEQISEFINGSQVDSELVDDGLEKFDIDEILENEIKSIIEDVTKIKIAFQSIKNSRRYLSNGS